MDIIDVIPVIIFFFGFFLVIFGYWYKEYILKKRGQESKCQRCGGELGTELIVLEEHYHYQVLSRELHDPLVKRLIYRGEEAKKRLEKPEPVKQCPTCGGSDIKYAYIEDGGMGYYCYQCRKSLKAMKDQKYYEKPSLQIKRMIICPHCANKTHQKL